MKIDVYNIKGEKVGDFVLPDKFFNIELNSDLINQVVKSQNANARFNLAHTKGRGEVRGGGKKPWRQKGTGRARHGSIRSPLWIGGGVTFGPTKEKKYGVKINKKMKRKALFMALSSKAKDKELILVDKIELPKKPQTKFVYNILKAFSLNDKKTIFVTEKNNKNMWLSARNLRKVKVLPSESLNAKDLLSYKNLILSKSVLTDIEKIYG